MFKKQNNTHQMFTKQNQQLNGMFKKNQVCCGSKSNNKDHGPRNDLEKKSDEKK